MTDFRKLFREEKNAYENHSFKTKYMGGQSQEKPMLRSRGHLEE